MLTEHDNFNLVLMPRNMFKALGRNKINLTDTIRYKELREILSQNDLAELCFINRELKVRDEYLTGNGFQSLLKVETEEENIEYSNIEDKLSTMAGVKESTLCKLYDLDDDNTELPFTVVTGTTFLLIVIEDGFLKYIESDHNLHLYLSLLFKELYKILPVPAVAKLSIFKMYMRLL